MLGMLALRFRNLASQCRDVSWVALWVFLRLCTCTFNVLTGGSFYETFCTRVARKSFLGDRPIWLWWSLHIVLDTVFWCDRGHCWNQFLQTAARRTRKLKWRIAWLWNLH